MQQRTTDLEDLDLKPVPAKGHAID